jgi:hypothetical protein
MRKEKLLLSRVTLTLELVGEEREGCQLKLERIDR